MVKLVLTLSRPAVKQEMEKNPRAMMHCGRDGWTLTGNSL
jgi:hypothetical protein